MSHWEIREGDALERLREMPDGSVQCCVTSPPYFGLRDYGIDGQIGLEASPDEFVARLVEVFREVRRVLRDDGTLWLNIGDSYAGSWGAQSRGDTTTGFNERWSGGKWSSEGKQADIHAAKPGLSSTQIAAHPKGTRTGSIPPDAGYKPKDLLGIPWLLAFALRQPYYTGTIRDERDRIWLAAMIDAEGCMFIHKRKVGQSNGQGYVRKNDSYGAGLEVSSTDRVIVERILAITGRGSICEQTPAQNDRRKQTIYRWNLRTNECREVIREVYPHLVAKQHEARLVCGCPSSGPDAARAHESLKAIHQGGTPDIDFAAPESMFEPGWYLRSDIIWSKRNCMPESVTDRPTSAHEHVFLLAKSARYFYDADAIRERAVSDHVSGNGYARDERETYRNPDGSARGQVNGWTDVGGSRNRRNVWEIATQPYPEAHFATFPAKLVEPCVLAGSSPKCCGECGAPWERLVERTQTKEGESYEARMERAGDDFTPLHQPNRPEAMWQVPIRYSLSTSSAQTVGWQSSCPHDDDTGRSVILDPFAGSGTTGLVALRHGRSFIGIELSPVYAEMARNRIRDDAPLLNTTAEVAA